MDVTGAKVIYLDQNQWITLTRCEHGKDDNPTTRRILEYLQEGVNSGQLILPLSIVHIEETVRRQDKDSRMRLASTIVGLSKGTSLAPHLVVEELEIRNAVNSRLGGVAIDLRPLVFGKGISHMLGAKPQLVREPGTSGPDLPEEKKKELLEFIESPHALLLLLESGDFRKMSEGVRLLHKTTAEQMESIRVQDEKIVDNDLRYRVTAAKFLVDYVGPKLFTVLQDLNVDITKVITKEMSRKEIDTFFQSIASTYVSFILTFRRDLNKHRKIQPNDINDIGFLSMAIPYCDVVVTESMWSSIAEQEKLDKLYGTRILGSLEELDSA